MQKSRIHKYLAWLLVFAFVCSSVSPHKAKKCVTYTSSNEIVLPVVSYWKFDRVKLLQDEN